jgi:hypothetical protein
MSGILLTASVHAADLYSEADLEGTVWNAEKPHSRTTVDIHGDLAIKEGKEIYVELVEFLAGVHTVRIHWWNLSKGINVMEYAVMVRVGENLFEYSEAEHPDDSGFPGIQGHGLFRLLDENTVELTQIGHLLDGSASAFVTTLHKVDAAPDVPIAKSYPAEAN